MASTAVIVSEGSSIEAPTQWSVPLLRVLGKGIIIWQHLVLEVQGADGVDDKDGGVKALTALMTRAGSRRLSRHPRFFPANDTG